jgi:predicted thioredoxin/glutaredoxin
MEETSSVGSLNEQLRHILEPLGVSMEVPPLEEQLRRILEPLRVRAEETHERADGREEATSFIVPLYQIYVTCEQADLAQLRENLIAWLRARSCTGRVLLGTTPKRQERYLVVVSLSPFPADLFEQIKATEEVTDYCCLNLAIDIGESEGDTDGGIGATPSA